MDNSLVSKIRKVPLIYIWATIIGLFVLATGLLSSRFFSNIAREDEIDRITEQSKLIASVVDPEEVAQYHADYSDTLNPGYNKLRDYFLGFCSQMQDVRYIYMFGQKQNKIFFYLDTEVDRHKLGAKRNTAAPGEIYTDAPAEFYAVFKNRQALAVRPYSDQWGSFVTVLIPVIDKKNQVVAAIGVDVEISAWNKTLRSKRMFPIVVSLVFISLIILISVFLRIRIDIQTETLEMYGRFESLLSNSKQAMVLFSLDFRVLYFNRKASRIAEVFLNGSLKIGKRITDLIKNEEFKARFIYSTQSLLTDNHIQEEIASQNKLYSFIYNYIQQTETEEPFVFLTIEDITKKRDQNDEMAVLLAEQSFLSEQYKYAVFLVNHELKILQSNSWVQERTGFSASALNGKYLDILMESDSLEQLIKEIEKSQSGTAYSIEMVIHYKSNYLSEGVSRLTKIIPVKSSSNKARYLFFCTDSAMINEPLIKAEAELDSALTIIDDLPGFVYRCKNDSFWTMLYLSRGFEHITGYAIEDVLNNNRFSFNDIIVPEYQESLVFKWQQSILNRSVFEEKYEIITATGECKWVWERGYALFDDDANVTELHGFITDVNDLQKSYRLVEDESATLKSYIDYAPQGMMQIDADMNIIRANFSALALVGYDLDFVRSQKMSFFIHPDSFNNYTVFVKKLIDFGTSSEELMLLTKSKTTRYVKLDALRFNNNDYIFYIVDNTQKYESQNRLLAQDRFMQSILDTISIPLAVVNTSTNATTYSNLIFNGLLDFQLEKIIGLNSSQDNPSEKTLINRVSSSLAVETAEYENNEQSENRYYLVKALPMTVTGDNVEEILIFLIDISIFKKSDRDLHAMLQKSESIILAKNDFFANLSHEIRNPINGIIGISELLINSTVNDFQLQYLNIIKESSLNLIYLINSILDYSKIEAGKIELVFEPFYPENLLNSLSMLFTQMCEKKGIGFYLSIDSSAYLQLVSDEIRIRQLLINIVGNAIRLTETGHVAVFISTKTIKNNVWLEMSVSDTGIGISPDKVDAVFDSFVQLNSGSANNQLETGLGLSVCKNIVEILKGSITVKSQVGVGSVFSVEIPVELAESKNREISYPKYGSLNILLVVLNEIERDLIKKMLLGLEVSVRDCENGIEALQIITDMYEQKKTFDYVFVDYLIDGITCLDVIKTIEVKQKQTPVVLFSNPLDFENAQKMKSLPSVRQVIAKPVLPSALVKVLQLNKGAQNLKPRALDFVSLSSSTILIVEDNAINMLVLKEILVYSGATIVEASDGQDAYIKFLSHRPQIIFMDIHMPIMDGFEVTKLIRNYCGENPEFVKPFIVALTAEVFKNKKEIYLAAGMDDYISKPFRIEDIKNCLQQYLKNEVL